MLLQSPVLSLQEPSAALQSSGTPNPAPSCSHLLLCPPGAGLCTGWNPPAVTQRAAAAAESPTQTVGLSPGIINILFFVFF